MTVSQAQKYPMTWEQAVDWLREQPDQTPLVRACFFDDPLLEAARRYHAGSEWSAVRELLPRLPGIALDVGAGRGIASYALASDGWTTTALEPDPSLLVGAEAIRTMAAEGELPITVVTDFGERMPFRDESFDVVHARQVLHHARDLEHLCREFRRVLKPGGTFIATREHVVDKESDLAGFLDAHPLHHLYGGENAFPLSRYLSALTRAGLEITTILSPWETDINLYPATLDDIRLSLARHLRFPFPRLIPTWYVHWASRRQTSPGRLYTFAGRRP
ncbi:Methyltransferase type 11 [Syntrophobacter sp. SbD1]|nr:Methyltransferase type 11 [Syntrophobacter sp. SbD1]